MKKMIFSLAILGTAAASVFAQTPTPPSRPATTGATSAATAAPPGGTGA